MAAPIIGYGNCVVCNAPVAHYKGAPKTKFCSMVHNVAYRRQHNAGYRERYLAKQRFRAKMKTTRRFALLALELQKWTNTPSL